MRLPIFRTFIVLYALMIFGAVLFLTGYGVYSLVRPHYLEPPDEKTVPDPNLIAYRVTAYCPCELCCGKWADGITASGHHITLGDRFVAAPKSIPFGTILDIPEYGVAEVLDRGGAIKGNRLDVFFSSHTEALRWGVKELLVARKE